MYSAPGRLVHTCLQVTLQVWQPMHLSRFITMPTCARIVIRCSPPRSRSIQPARESVSVHHRGQALADHRHLIALRAGGTVVVEAPRELRVAADQMRWLYGD